MAITIPQKLRKHLKDDNCKWERRIGTLIEKLEPILDQTPEFFPQYTNHGLKHVETVLKMTAELIPGKSLGKNALSSRDIACLIAAILIHDLGMFLKPDGLTMLMTPEWDQHRRSDLDKSSWSDAWDQYITSTKRLPVSQKIRCFGKDLTTEHITLDKDKMVYDDKLVIGEFLRRHHPRLAYEIAVAGLPGSTPQKFLENSGFNETDCRIIGLMARSHGMPLREVEDHLGSNAHHSNLPVYYLMSVLRLADYLDASENRAPMVRLKQERLTSPLSQEEWALNQCFKIDSSRWYSDTKNYSIDATPNSSSEFARLEKWLKDVQSELDQCWAILAEKYPNSKLRLSIHRIKCTMYEGLNYKTLSGNILPREVKVTANPEIVKLMMEPLYGDDPTYGVRELLQNAVDACLEREQWEKTHKDGDPNYKGLVDIRIENDVFTITDNGMGMNEDVLLNYYLSAGSSYRSSDAWMAANAPDGKSQVARTGKFGVGFLAAFLLGNEVEVLTQHREDEKGYHFTFSQDAMPLDVKRLERHNPYAAEVSDPEHTGTTITIKLKSNIHQLLQKNDTWYNWYAFDTPDVRYFMSETEKPYNGIRLKRVPQKNLDWFSVPASHFVSFQWKPTPHQFPKFYCNGIRIKTFNHGSVDSGLRLKMPHISVIDTDAVLDVDVSRSQIQTFPDFELLAQQMYHCLVAHLLMVSWDSPNHLRHNLTTGFDFLQCTIDDTIPYLLSPCGFTLNHISVLAAMDIRKYLALMYQRFDPSGVIEKAHHFTPPNIPIAIVYSYDDIQLEHLEPSFLKQSNRPFQTFCETFCGGGHSAYDTGYGPKTYRKTVWVQGEHIEHLAPKMYFPHTATSLRSSGIHKWENDRNVIPSEDRIMLDDAAFSKTDFLAAVEINIPKNSSMFEKYLDSTADTSLFTRILTDLLTAAPDYPDQSLWIPFDMEERRRKFPKAFKELKPYMDHIQKYPIE